MIINIAKDSLEKVESLFRTHETNILVSRIFQKFLLNFFDSSFKEEVFSLVKEYDVTFNYAYFCVLLAFSDIQISREETKKIYNEYFSKTIKELNPFFYLNNPYYQKIKIKDIGKNNWSFEYQKYESYEGFIYNDLSVIEDQYYKEIPNFGYFATEFNYLSVLENKIEWMSITPNEIETMKKPISLAFKNVLTFGLGMGYFAYMASLKSDVETVTIVEKDYNVISLFKSNILPLFENKTKIIIIHTDALTFAKSKINQNKYDFVFVDIYRNSLDGLEWYLKLRKIESKHWSLSFSYWIETSILSLLRRVVIACFREEYTNLVTKSRDDKINALFKKVKDYYKEYKISNYYDLNQILTDESLRILAAKI